jgi:D-alanine-D-alanine ligase
MPEKICIVYNAPDTGRCSAVGEHVAIAGVLQAVDSVQEALEGAGRLVSRLAFQPPLERGAAAIRRLAPDLVFNLFEGFDNDPVSESAMARLLEGLGLRFTGAPAPALRRCCSKQETKALLRGRGLPTADWLLVNPGDRGEPNTFPLEFPCIVKPVCADASHGICSDSVVADLPALRRQVARVHATYDQPALVEAFLPGREFNVLVMAPPLRVFPVSEIIYRLPPGTPPILTYGAKWLDDDPAYHMSAPCCPAAVDAGLRAEIQDLAVRTFALLVGRGYARIDVRMDGNGRLMVMDVNPNPDIGPGSGALLQAQCDGLSRRAFIDLIVAAANGARPPGTGAWG